MRQAITFLFASFLALAPASAAASSSSAITTPQLPSKDPFYIQPGNISSYKPGDVIRTRQVPAAFPSLEGKNVTVSYKASYQFLYRTTDSIGRAVAAVTSLYVPTIADPTKLLSYQAPYDSSVNDCSPSYVLQARSENSSVTDALFIASALKNGWYVVNPDYEGLQAAFTAGVEAGLATIDSIRAVLSSGALTGLSPKARYALMGYSGGSIASEWAAELQPSYAPNLDFAGVAAGGLIPNISNVLLTINNGSFAGLAFSGITGFGRAYPNLTAYLNQQMIPSKVDEFNSIAAHCAAGVAAAGQNKDLFQYFKIGKQVLYDAVPVAALAAGGRMGVHGVPKAPLFVYKAVQDQISPVADTDDVVAELCAKGATIEYHRDLVGDHVSEALAGSASAFGWIADRLNGLPVLNQGTCIKQDVVLTSLSIETVLELGAEAISILQSLLIGGPTK